MLVGRSPEWTVPGVLLLGDASHPMSPVRARGTNLALGDSIVAANYLISILRDGGSIYPSSVRKIATALGVEPGELVRAS